MNTEYESAKLIARYDAKIKVEVPAEQGRKAYSYYREGAEPQEASPKRGGGKWLAAGIGGALSIGGMALLAKKLSKKQVSTVNVQTEEKKSLTDLQKAGIGAAGATAIGAGVNAMRKAKEPESESKPVFDVDPMVEPDTNKIYPSISANQSQSLSEYTGSEYMDIRAAEKKGLPYFLRSEETGDEFDAVSEINGFLENQKKYKGSISRGFSMEKTSSESFLEQIQSSGLKLRAMSSFTTDADVARRYARADQDETNLDGKKKSVGIVLNVKENFSGVSISGYAQIESENEVLCPKRAVYKATKITKSKGSKGRDVFFIDLEEVRNEKN